MSDRIPIGTVVKVVDSTYFLSNSFIETPIRNGDIGMVKYDDGSELWPYVVVFLQRPQTITSRYWCNREALEPINPDKE